jgi:antitoxin CptB
MKPYDHQECIDMQEDLAIRIKRLKYRSWHRGTKELDLVIGNFADKNLEKMTTAEIDQFEAIIEEDEFDIYNWLTRKDPIPVEHQNAVMDRLLKFELVERGE